MAISQINLIQLIVFLERQPLKNFANMQAFNKVNGAIKDLKKQLGDYYKDYEKLEMAQVQVSQPFMQQANILRDTYKHDEEKLKTALAEVQEAANKDKKVVAAFKALNEFKLAEDDKPTEIQIQNPDHKIAVKDIFEANGLQFESWQNRDVMATLSEYLGV